MVKHSYTNLYYPKLCQSYTPKIFLFHLLLINKLSINESCKQLWEVNTYSACFYFCSVNKAHSVFKFTFKSVTFFLIFFLISYHIFFLILLLTLLRSLLELRTELKKKKKKNIIEERMKWLQCMGFICLFSSCSQLLIFYILQATIKSSIFIIHYSCIGSL